MAEAPVAHHSQANASQGLKVPGVTPICSSERREVTLLVRGRVLSEIGTVSYLVKWASMASHSFSASANVVKGDPPTLPPDVTTLVRNE